MTRTATRITALLAAAQLVHAGGATAWESNTFSDFIRGRFQGVSLTRDGRLTLAPALNTLSDTGDAGVWSVASAPDGTVYFATGHRGRVWQMKPGAKPTLLWTAPQPEVFALAVDGSGRLYAGTSPDGRVYRIEGGKAVEFFDPKDSKGRDKYIWALACGANGTVFVGTGDQGRIWSVDSAGKGQLWYETGQTHVTSLAVDSAGRLLAGSEPNGILYRIEAKDKAFVLYDSSLPEIRSIYPAPDGSIYVAALGGALAQKQATAAASSAAAQQNTGVVTTSITVTDADASTQTGVDLKPKPEPPKPPTAEQPAPPPVPVDISGVEKAAIYRVSPDSLVETLWSSKEENVFDISVQGQEILFSTDQRGRIYRLSPDLKSTLVVETREGETTRLLRTPQGILATTSNAGKLYLLAAVGGGKGVYESPVHDASNIARWGHLAWHSEGSPAGFAFRTRSGNSQRPDKTWSDWSAPISDAAKAAISSPNARFIQWQVEMSAAGAAPMLDSVSVSYQTQNTRPTVRSIQVTPQWVASTVRTAVAQPAPVSYSITVTDSGDAGSQSSAGTPTQNVNRTGSPQLYISWQADDPESDKLVYSLWYRAEDERDWKLLKADLGENTYTQDAEVFADGRFYFRVIASDRLANSPSAARESDLVSQPVLIDQTPPVVTLSPLRRNGTQVEFDVKAVDGASPVRRAEFSVNGSPWRMLEAADGIADSKEENFTVRLAAQPTEQSIVVRAYDANGNPGLARIVVR